jgi:hypothetical protein
MPLIARSRSRPWLRQVLLFLAAYLAYSAGRWLAIGDVDAAVATARDILHLERLLGIDVEHAVQRALDRRTLIAVLNWTYLAAQLAVVPAVLALSWRAAPPVYRRLRDTVLVSWVLSLPVYALLPVAPPRLAGVGLADTISREAAMAMDSRLATSFYNPIAAVPSLHAGFALAVSLALWRLAARAGSGPVAICLRLAALVWTPVIALVVVATGNHFVLDVAAGLVVAGAADAFVRRAGGLPRRPRAAARPSSLAYIPDPGVRS